jgi:nucleoside-diphosphate-sugar epimerase/glycosyltransferase involved in cell wall biosynthesis
MNILFWLCIAFIAYVYFGYPLLLVSGLLGRRKRIMRSKWMPRVSIVVPAHNEASVIREKLENLLSLDFPTDYYEILVGSDGSTDQTEEIVRQFSARGVRLVVNSLQRGKSAIQNSLVDKSTGEIIVFTDADCRVPHNALRILAEDLADPEIGLVTARPIYSNLTETNITQNEGRYWQYESWLRQEESDRGLLCTASGALFAMRRILWQPLDARLGDDFVLPVRVALRGWRNIVDSRIAVSSDLTQKHPGLAVQMRKRIISKDLRGLHANREILNPFRTGAVALSLFSHKLLRWLVPVFLIGLFVSNLFLLNSPFHRVAIIAQVLFYVIAGAAALRAEDKLGAFWSIPLSFCVMNLGALLGAVHFLMGRTMGQWQPVRQGPHYIHDAHILVLGGAGYIGSCLVRKLLADGRRVRVMDSLAYGDDAIREVHGHPNFELQVGDCRNIQDLVAAVKGVDAIIDLAAIVGDPACEVDRQLSLETNYAATRMLIEVAKGHGICRLIFTSSCSVYGASDLLMDESSGVQPISLYAETKVDSEEALLSARSTEFHPIILRLATVFGLSSRARFDLIVNFLTAKAHKEGLITIYNGTQWRPFIHVQEVAEGIIRVLDAPLSVVSGEIYNLGDSRLNFTLSQVANKVVTEYPATRVKYIDSSDRRSYRVSFDKIRKHIGLECRLNLEDGIREIREALDSELISDYTDARYYNERFLKLAGYPTGKNELARDVMAALTAAPARGRTLRSALASQAATGGT